MDSNKDDILNAKDLALDFDEPESDDLENEEEFSDEDLKKYEDFIKTANIDYLKINHDQIILFLTA